MDENKQLYLKAPLIKDFREILLKDKDTISAIRRGLATLVIPMAASMQTADTT